ncbi:MAG: metallophosphoesterase family protein [Bacilli bacterium]
MIDEENNILNIINYNLLKCRSFEVIRDSLNISSSELIEFISEINKRNNQTIYIKSTNGIPHIAYSKREYKIHCFAFPHNTLKLMLVSDKHIGHSEDNIKYITSAYNEAIKRGVTYVFDLGDILNGPSNRIHNPRKISAGNLDTSLARLKRYHPTDIPTYFITGNHDLKFMENDKCDIGRVIASECKNMFFLNNLFSCLDIGGLKINLSHGSMENKRLSEIKINKEFRFLKLNAPHIICQGHFHMGGEPIGGETLLCQVPSLKSVDSSTNKLSNYQAGVLFLTIKEFNKVYEIEVERQEFIESKTLVKKEVYIKKS